MVAATSDGAAASLLFHDGRVASDGQEYCHQSEIDKAAEQQDNFFDWDELEEATSSNTTSKDMAQALDIFYETKVDKEEEEEAPGGLFSLATSVAGSVAGAVSAVGDAVDAMGDATKTVFRRSSSSLAGVMRSLAEDPEEAEHNEEDLEETVGGSAPSGCPAACQGPQAAAGEDASAEEVVSPGNDRKFRIAVIMNGSEGDARPIIALAKVLSEEMGYRIRVFTNANLVHISLRHGIDAVPVFANSQTVIQKLGGMRGTFMEAVAKPAKAAERWLKEHEGEFVHVGDALTAFEPQAIIAGSQVTALVMRWEKEYGIPVIPTYFSRSHIEETCFNVLINQEPPRPSFFAVSEVVDQKPLPSNRIMRTGAWVLSEMPTPQELAPGGPLCELKDFLDRGAPPVAVGWGSMLAAGLPPAEMLELALRALMQAGRRGVVIGGWAELDRVAAVAADGRLPSRLNDGGKLATFAKEQVCFVPWAPHDWLFPRCCCVLHHGGVGTLQAALRTGRPSVVTPICADQFMNAEVVEAKHVGVGFTKALPEIKPGELSKAITTALGGASVSAAQTVGRKAQREDGQSVSRAAEMVDGFLKGKIRLAKSGKWVKRLNTEKVHS